VLSTLRNLAHYRPQLMIVDNMVQKDRRFVKCNVEGADSNVSRPPIPI